MSIKSILTIYIDLSIVKSVSIFIDWLRRELTKPSIVDGEEVCVKGHWRVSTQYHSPPACRVIRAAGGNSWALVQKCSPSSIIPERNKEEM